MPLPYILGEGEGDQENSLKPPLDIYKASLKSTINLDNQFTKFLGQTKNTLLLYIIGFVLFFTNGINNLVLLLELYKFKTFGGGGSTISTLFKYY